MRREVCSKHIELVFSVKVSYINPFNYYKNKLVYAAYETLSIVGADDKSFVFSCDSSTSTILTSLSYILAKLWADPIVFMVNLKF